MAGLSQSLAAMAVAAASAAAGQVVTKTETVFLNVPLSMLYVAIAGAFIGVFLLPSRDVARISTDTTAAPAKRMVHLVFTGFVLLSAVLAYSFIASWIVQFAFGAFRVTDESLILPAAGLMGVGIRPWLPGLMKAVERRADRVIGGDP